MIFFSLGTSDQSTTNYYEETKYKSEVKCVCYTHSSVYLPGGRSFSAPTKLFMRNSCVYTQAGTQQGVIQLP